MNQSALNFDIRYFFRKSKSKNPVSEKSGFIYFYIRLNEMESDHKATGISCRQNEWNTVTNTISNVEKNLILSAFDSRLRQAKSALDFNGKPYHPNDIIKLVESKSNSVRKLLLEVSDLYRKQQSELIEAGSIKKSNHNNYSKFDKILRQYLTSIKRVLYVDEIDKSFCEHYQHYLLTKKRHKQSYVNKAIKYVRTLGDFAVSHRFIGSNLTKFFKITPDKFDRPVVLSIEDTKKLESIKFLNPTLERICDAFLFSRYTCLHYGDYVELNHSEHYRLDEKNQAWIIKPRLKSHGQKEWQTIPLDARAQRILAKYGGSLDNLPRSSNVTMNRYLKIIGQQAGVSISITFKAGRKTFISECHNAKKMRETTIARMAGWTSIRQLKIYSQLEMDTIRDEFFGT